MATSPTVFAPQKVLEDPLAHLPCSSIVEYKKGQMIYNQDQPSTNIYLIIEGKIKVSRMADEGHYVVVDMYQPDEFFGESALLNLPHRGEQATAMELSLIHISEPTRRTPISYAVFCLQK